MFTSSSSSRLITARLTALWYLGLALTGLVGTMVLLPRITADNPASALARMHSSPEAAGWAVALALGVVITQAMAAVWFTRLFEPVDAGAARAIGAFGLINSALITVGATALGVAAQVARDNLPGAADTVFLMHRLNEHIWITASVFFGLWLIPMGLCVLRSGTMPRSLGWLLVVGGVLYVAAAFPAYVAPSVTWAPLVLSLPATIAEFWMIVYLLLFGIRTPAPAPAAAVPALS